MVQKGEIVWCDNIRVEVKSKSMFFVITPERTYYLDDVEQQNAAKWAEAIGDVSGDVCDIMLDAEANEVASWTLMCVFIIY